MDLTKLVVILVFTLLQLIQKIVASPSNQRTLPLNTSPNQTSTNKSPYWEYILREFVFKTISSPPKSSNILHKKLLDAPFYGGPLPTTSNEDNVLLSRGNVYHLPDGQWILCQDNCNDCTPCIDQKNSIVKWTLRKVKHFISADSYKYDLQLTVVPLLKDGALTDFQTRNYVYVPYDAITTDNTTSTTKMSHTDRSMSWSRTQRDSREKINQHNDLHENSNLMNLFSNILSAPNNQHNVSNLDHFQPTYRLIMGIDQSAKKHVIHVVSIDSSEISDINHIQKDSNDKNDTINHNPDQNIRGPFYQQYINKLLESINLHRPIIEAFLSYNHIKIDNSTAPINPVYSEFIDKNNTKLNFNFETRSKNDYPRDWSQILTRIPRDKNYIPKLIKKFNGNFMNIVRSRSISLF